MKKIKFLIISLIILFLLSLSTYSYLKKAREDRDWPFNTRLIEYLPESVYKFLKYRVYKYTDPSEKIISTFYYKIKLNYNKIPSASAGGKADNNGGAINLLTKDMVLVMQDNGGAYLFDLNTKKFTKNEIDLQTSFLNIRDVKVEKETKEILILGVSKTLDDCRVLKLISLNYKIDKETIKTDKEQEIFSSEKVCDDLAPIRHSGARVIYYNSNYYIAVGMFSRINTTTHIGGISRDPQDSSNTLGKIIKVNKDKEFSIYSMGHRNPQGLFFSRKKNLIFSTEHGPRGGDELNIIEEGGNYGWPCVTLGTFYIYKLTNIESDMWRSINEIDGCNKEQVYQDPAYTWTPSIAISQGFEYEGGHFKKFKNNLIIGSFGGGSIFRVHLTKSNKIVNIERIEIKERVRDIIEVNDGKILVYTDSQSLILITKS